LTLHTRPEKGTGRKKGNFSEAKAAACCRARLRSRRIGVL